MFKFKKLTIKLRLNMAIAFASILMMAIGSMGLFGMGKTKDEMLVMYQSSVLPAQQLSEIQRLLFSSRMRIADSLANPSAGGIQKSTAEVEQNIAETSRLWDAYLSNKRLSREDKLLTVNFSETRKLFENDVLNPTVAALRARNLKLADEILWEKVDPLYKAVEDALQPLLQMQIDDGKQIYTVAANRFESTRNTAIAIIAAAITLALWLGISLIRAITRPLEQALMLASAVAQGDLTHRIEVKSRDEFGQLLQVLKDMNDNLAGIVGDVRASSEIISASTQEIAKGNADLSQRTEEQASSLEGTAASVEELTSTVRQNAENAKQANQLAVCASGIAVKGGQVVGEVVNTMASISTSSKKIVDIIGVIEGIAFQTNILALNAAVEAARAGVQGRGFAVVAGEVRNLAQRSAAAAKEIKGLIEDSVNKVDAGSKQVDQAGATMAEIVQAVNRVTVIMAEIAAASSEQSAGIEQVNQAIVQIDEVTQQNATLVEEAAAATESMRKQADNLTAAVSIFKLGAANVRSQAESAKSEISRYASKPAPAKSAYPAMRIKQVALVRMGKTREWEETEPLVHRA